MSERLSDEQVKEIANGNPALLSVRLARELVECHAEDTKLTPGEKAYWRRRCRYVEGDLALMHADIERLAAAINNNQHRLTVPRVTDEFPQGMSAIDAAIEVIEGRGTRIVEPLGCPTPGACSCPMPAGPVMPETPSEALCDRIMSTGAIGHGWSFNGLWTVIRAALMKEQNK